MLKYVSFLLSSFNIHVRMTLIHSVSFPQVGSLGVDYTCLLSDLLKINTCMKQQQQFLANILPPGPWFRLHLVHQTHGEGEISGRQSVLVSVTTSIHEHRYKVWLGFGTWKKKTYVAMFRFRKLSSPLGIRQVQLQQRQAANERKLIDDGKEGNLKL